MNNFIAILLDSFWELKSRKILYVLGFILGLSIIAMILFFMFALSFEIQGEKIFDGEFLNSSAGQKIFGNLFDTLLGFCMFLLALGSAWMIPAFLTKGRIELVLSKPINRQSLLLMKFFGIYLNLIAVLSVITIILWLVFSIGTGFWGFSFFLGLLLAYVKMFVIYSIIFCFGLFGNTGAMALIGYFVISFIQGLVSGPSHIISFLNSSFLEHLYNVTYHIFPKLNKISSEMTNLIGGSGIDEIYPIWSSILFSVVLLGLAIIYFKRHDY